MPIYKWPEIIKSLINFVQRVLYKDIQAIALKYL